MTPPKPLPAPDYIACEPRADGYALVMGYSTLSAAQAAQAVLVSAFRDAAEAGGDDDDEDEDEDRDGG